MSIIGKHNAPFPVFIGLVKILVGDFLPAHLTSALVSDPPAVLVMDLVQVDVVVLGSAVSLDRHVHQAEGN